MVHLMTLWEWLAESVLDDIAKRQNLAKSCKGEEVVENFSHRRPEGTWLKEEESAKVHFSHERLVVCVLKFLEDQNYVSRRF